jgi:hypothetical protein
VKPPPPMCYHPELFPERAAFNPQPTNHQIKKRKDTKSKVKKKKRKYKFNN